MFFLSEWYFNYFNSGISGTAHCANMYSYFEGEVPQLTEAREEVSRLIGVWLGVETSGATGHYTITILNALLMVLGSFAANKYSM